MSGEHRLAECERPEPQVVHVANAGQSEQRASDRLGIERERRALHESKKGVAQDVDRGNYDQNAEQEGADRVRQLPIGLRVRR